MKRKKIAPSPAAAPSIERPVPATTGFKGFILLVISIISLIILFGIKQNRVWLTQRVILYWNEFKEQKLNLDLEERKLARYQTDYMFAKNITSFFEKKGITGNVLVLLPSSDYFKAHGLNIHVPEPAVFYYYTGLKTIWPNSPEAAKANYYIGCNKGHLLFDTVINKQVLQDTIARFNKYKIYL